jgi:hypothetical protein
MPNRRVISRRYVVALSAASVVTVAGGFGGASAQSAKRIEQLAPELDKKRLKTPPYAPSIWRQMGPWRVRPIGYLPSWAGLNRACPTA